MERMKTLFLLSLLSSAHEERETWLPELSWLIVKCGPFPLSSMPQFHTILKTDWLRLFKICNCKGKTWPNVTFIAPHWVINMNDSVVAGFRSVDSQSQQWKFRCKFKNRQTSYRSLIGELTTSWECFVLKFRIKTSWQVKYLHWARKNRFRRVFQLAATSVCARLCINRIIMMKHFQLLLPTQS